MFKWLSKFFKKRKLVKVYLLQQKKDVYLIKRIFKHIASEEYLICLNYDFKSNTYFDGRITFNISQAYMEFNYFVKNRKFSNQDEEVDHDDSNDFESNN